jgi:predicted metalloendopeptidase
MNKVSTTTRSKRQYLAREFFRAFADAWRQNATPEKMKKYETDVHAAPKLRVNGNVCLTDAWYRVFGITEGHMYLAPDERIQIW